MFGRIDPAPGRSRLGGGDAHHAGVSAGQHWWPLVGFLVFRILDVIEAVALGPVQNLCRRGLGRVADDGMAAAYGNLGDAGADRRSTRRMSNT